MKTKKLQIIESMIKTDETLTKSGIPADSAAVGEAITESIEDVVYAEEDSSDVEYIPINADTLGGKPASDYATQSFVTNKIAEAQLGGGSGEIDLIGYATKDELNIINNKIPTTAEQVGARPDTWLPSLSDINAAPASHLDDKNNPHGVTAEQIGARPDTWMPTAAEIGARPDTWFPTIAEIGAAPSGYGLGEYATNISYKSLESVFKSGKSGLYRGQVITELTEFGNQWVWLDIRIESATYGIAYGCTYGGNKFIVRFASGVVQPLEWENPPMDGGTYRTTERCEGKPVYARRINCLAAPASVDTSFLNIDKVVRWSGFVTYYGVALPTSNANWKVEISNIAINTESAYTQASAHFYIDLYFTQK